MPKSSMVGTEENDRSPGRMAQRRVWLLLMLDGAERADLTPMPSQQLHRMVFLANCLSPLYDVPIADGEILKYRRGPFYPDLQWDLDRLVGMGLVEISSLRLERDEQQEAWLYADYALAHAGLDMVHQVLDVSPAARERHAFYLEVAGAYAALDVPGREDAALQDANYRRPEAQLNTLIDFSEGARNASVQAAHTFETFAPAGIDVSDRDKLHLYFRYLNRMVEKAAG